MPLPNLAFNAVVENETVKHLLVGNGLSCALDADLFNFHSLFEKADLTQELIALASEDNLGTYPDFEKTLKTFHDSEIILQHLGQEIPDQFEDIQQQVRDGLVRAVNAIHTLPDDSYVTDFTREQIVSFARFLSHFNNSESNIFSLNYDLLLYRALMEIKRPNSENLAVALGRIAGHGNLRSWGDGFVTAQGETFKWEHWSDRGHPRVSYLHGALHIFTTTHGTCKIVAGEQGLILNVNNRITNGEMPLIVCEGSHNRKLERIFGNEYLRDCFSRLSQISGDLVIFGSSLSEIDKHVWQQLDGNTNLEHIFVSYHGDATSANIEAQARLHFRHKVQQNLVSVFDSSSMNIWN